MPNNSFMDGDEIPVRAASYSLVKSYLRQRIENLRGDETPRWDVRRRCSIANSRETFFLFPSSLFFLTNRRFEGIPRVNGSWLTDPWVARSNAGTMQSGEKSGVGW